MYKWLLIGLGVCAGGLVAEVSCMLLERQFLPAVVLLGGSILILIAARYL